MRKIYLIAMLSVAVGMTGCSDNRPNIVLIVADDLGWTDLGVYGSTFYNTPNLDQLAGDGIRFTNGYATCPVCSPSRSSVQTGLYPTNTGVTDWIKGRASYRGSTVKDRLVAAPTAYEMLLDETTIAEVLKAEGYSTFFAGKWHLGEDSIYWPEAQGYDINKGGYRRGAPNRGGGFDGYFSPYGNPRLEDGPRGEYLPERLADETLRFIDAHFDTPFFVCLSFYLVHTPLQAKDSIVEEYRMLRRAMGSDTLSELDYEAPWIEHATVSRSYKERLLQAHPVYAAMVQALDVNTGRVIARLKEKGVYDNTIILFTSDNGGLSTAEGSPTSNRPLRGGKGWLYEGGIRVPYILKTLDERQRGLISDIPVTGADILPTLGALAGIGISQKPLDGIDIMPFVQNASQPGRALFWHYPHYSNQGGNPGSVIRLGDHKLIHDFETGGLELYNLAEDLGEQHDLSDQQPALRDSLFHLLDAWRVSTGALMMDPNPSWDGVEPVVR